MYAAVRPRCGVRAQRGLRTSSELQFEGQRGNGGAAANAPADHLQGFRVTTGCGQAMRLQVQHGEGRTFDVAQRGDDGEMLLRVSPQADVVQEAVAPFLGEGEHELRG